MADITQAELKELLHYDEDTGVFTWLVDRGSRTKAGDIAGSQMPNGKVQLQVNKRNYQLHRLAWLYVYGEFPSESLEHINNVCSDNRVANLRHEVKAKDRGQITQKELKEYLSYNPDNGVFTWLKIPKWSHRIVVGEIAGKVNSQGYLQIQLFGRVYRMHRLAWFYMHGVFPSEQIDHQNHIRDDNRIANLRCVTAAENRRNQAMHKRNTSGVTGVHEDKARNKWTAAIGVDGKFIHLGRFDDMTAAVNARLAANIKYNFHPMHGVRL